MKPVQICVIFKNVMFPLLIGGLIYIFFRSYSLKMFIWFEAFGLSNIIKETRIDLLPMKAYLPKWIYFSLPDGLWIYSFTSALIIYWEGEFDRLKYWLLIPFFIGIVFEVFQAFTLFKGTFDILDLLFSLSGFLLSLYILKNKFMQHEKKPY